MANFNDYLNGAKAGISEVAVSEFAQYKKELESETKEFLSLIKEDLQRWTSALVEGKLSKTDFEFLVRGKGEHLRLRVLSNAGIASAKADKLRNKIVGIVIEKAFLILLA